MQVGPGGNTMVSHPLGVLRFGDPCWRKTPLTQARNGCFLCDYIPAAAGFRLIARELKIPVSTVGLECRRLGVARLKNLDPPTPAIRYEQDRPGELLHLDTKKLARIERVGHRNHGDRSKRVSEAGWEFLHVCIDDATRLTYAEMLSDERGQRAAGFLRRGAIRWYAAQGSAHRGG